MPRGIGGRATASLEQAIQADLRIAAGVLGTQISLVGALAVMLAMPLPVDRGWLGIMLLMGAAAFSCEMVTVGLAGRMARTHGTPSRELHAVVLWPPTGFRAAGSILRRLLGIKG